MVLKRVSSTTYDFHAVFLTPRLQRLATAEAPKSAAEASLNLPPKKKRGLVRRTALYATIFGTVFYGGSTAVALTNDRYRDFFVESVPLGESIIDYAENHGWDEAALSGLPKIVIDASKRTYNAVSGAVSRTLGSTSSTSAQSSSSSTSSSSTSGTRISSAKEAVKEKSHNALEVASSVVDNATSKAGAVAETVKTKTFQFTSDVQELVDKVEEALRDKVPSTSHSSTPAPTTPRQGVEFFAPEPSPEPSGKKCIHRQTSLGF